METMLELYGNDSLFHQEPIDFCLRRTAPQAALVSRFHAAVHGLIGNNFSKTGAMLLLPFLATYLFTYLRVYVTANSKGTGKRVPTSPYWFPILGHVFQFLWSTSNLPVIASSASGLLGVRLATQKIIFITGSENINKVWRAKVLQAREVNFYVLQHFFGTPKTAFGTYVNDTSGTQNEPYPGSNILDKNRYYYHKRKNISEFFNGPGLQRMAYQFQKLLHTEMTKWNIGQEWCEFPDLYHFVQHLVTGPAVEAMCGPRLIEKNPNFVTQFWKLDTDLYWFFKAVPNFLLPSALSNRKVLLESIKEWHAFARANYNDSQDNEFGHDPFWGSPLLRTRADVLSRVDGLCADALASEDLGLLWAENGNSIPAVFWMLVELLQSPEALREATIETNEALSVEQIRSGTTIDINLLCRKPLLQSAYAETLRVYTSLFMTRSAVHSDFHLGNWRIPEGELLAVDGRVAQMDPAIWNNSRTISKHVSDIPVSEFCAQRFLRWPDDTVKGPRTASTQYAPIDDQTAESNSNKPYFSVDGLSGAWVPYGGGSRQCPGKQFAKQEIILSFAMIMANFEIEFCEDPKVTPILPNLKYYGLGTFAPARKVPFKIRRRV